MYLRSFCTCLKSQFVLIPYESIAPGNEKKNIKSVDRIDNRLLVSVKKQFTGKSYLCRHHGNYRSNRRRIKANRGRIQ